MSPAAAFDTYLYVRERVKDLRAAPAPSDALTPAERRMAATLAPLWDATPEMIAGLRRYGGDVGGVDATNYTVPDPVVTERHERDLRRLLQRSDRSLWVGEPTALGGFGVDGKTERYNDDTLRFFRVVSLLQDAALMKDFQVAGSRRTVWEIGGGWGGFAYQIKTLCRDVTYLITAAPELLLLSAVYLMTLFPSARFRFFEPSAAEAFWADWHAVDFAFAPEQVVDRMRPPALDLAVDLAALAQMTEARIRTHVRRAYDLGCRYVASVSPAGDSAGESVPQVHTALELLYWRHPVSAPAYVAKRLSLRDRGGVAAAPAYFFGWRRLRP
jgi:hypothetical protein